MRRIHAARCHLLDFRLGHIDDGHAAPGGRVKALHFLELSNGQITAHSICINIFRLSRE